MFSFAQTNLQLLHQLCCADYTDNDLDVIAKAYRLATRLFTGYFRGSGKTSIAHLVGTASILASVAAPIEVITAGLLHAAYEFGDFGDGVRGISKHKRQSVRRVVGEVTENYVAQYMALRWNESTILEFSRNLEGLSKTESYLLLIRLANELEDHLDRGILYCENVEKRLHYLKNCGDLMTEMAINLGFPTLAQEMSQVFTANLSTTITSEIKSDHAYSYLIPTTPYIKRLIGQLHYRVSPRFEQLFAIFAITGTVKHESSQSSDIGENSYTR
ncbi:MAG: DUF6817 domain-containing protein [Nostoc sp.]|uniref:DUF6817 domain-containing protein n=1 Tax=Nostoc sp. TaxID=1180 RepID=UPI002FF96F50